LSEKLAGRASRGKNLQIGPGGKKVGHGGKEGAKLNGGNRGSSGTNWKERNEGQFYIRSDKRIRRWAGGDRVSPRGASISRGGRKKEQNSFNAAKAIRL